MDYNDLEIAMMSAGLRDVMRRKDIMREIRNMMFHRFMLGAGMSGALILAICYALNFGGCQ